MTVDLKRDIKEGNKKILFLCILYSFYIILKLLNSSVISIEMYLATSFFTIIIFHNSVREMEEYKTTVLLLFGAALSNYVVGCFWIFSYILNGPVVMYSDALVMINFIPNIFILLAAIHYFKRNIYNLQSVQLTIDIVTVVILMISFTIIFFMDANFKSIISLKHLVAISYVLTDISSISIIIIIKLSISNFKNQNVISLFGIGIIVFTIVDLGFIYQILSKGHYESMCIVESYNFLPYLIFSFISIYSDLFKEGYANNYNYEMPYNITVKRKNSLIIFLPIVFMLFIKKTEFFALIVFAGVILIRELLSYYVRFSYYTKKLLNQEKALKYELEKMVRVRTRELLNTNKRLEDIVNKDYLTKIYNRRFFNIEVDKLLREERVGEVNLYFIDLIRFKFINDSFGHDIGDEILIYVGRRLIKILPKEGLVCRLGGDEFAVILKGKKTKEELSLFAKEIIKSVSEEIIINNYRFYIEPSIGIATSKKDSTRRSLLKGADFAMYRCKNTQGSFFEFYDEELNRELERKNEIEKLLKNVSFDEEFKVLYQPQFDINTRTVIGTEALVRWESKELGNISPSEFIPIAEECGMIESIGNWVLIEALKKVKVWNKKYNTSLRASVNVSPGQINSIGFTENLLNVVKKYNVETRLVNLEITEGIKLEGNDYIKDVLCNLSNLGFSISIDDFGTGYASFSYLEKFNINEIKIDKSLVDNITTKKSDLKIVKAIIMMAKGMNIETIAEGIETEDQLNKIKSLGCDEIQGYVWSKPLLKEEFEEEYLKRGFCLSEITN
ncbi:EAL domain-containing protein [Clostridium sp. LY3-2]|uniref:putative bifunctional diguanylate cyclase/phosphodiesterase n=1 Tax=Clostridium sp. LY3-2 TaxID=2942482 RepID=UPI0021526EBA|nr:GGDEF domain-containing phosphodiesterase [Clostridium sp. LY3-2]MCR6513810.1 EAL domain-containing protein [Clostridium sp. LY3-2]